MKRRVLEVAAISLACAACCAPLLLPLFLGAGFAGLGAGASSALLGLPLEVVICAAILVALAVGFGIWMTMRRAAVTKACGCDTACSVDACAPSGAAGGGDALKPIPQRVPEHAQHIER